MSTEGLTMRSESYLLTAHLLHVYQCIFVPGRIGTLRPAKHYHIITSRFADLIRDLMLSSVTLYFMYINHMSVFVAGPAPQPGRE